MDEILKLKGFDDDNQKKYISSSLMEEKVALVVDYYDECEKSKATLVEKWKENYKQYEGELDADNAKTKKLAKADYFVPQTQKVIESSISRLSSSRKNAKKSIVSFKAKRSSVSAENVKAVETLFYHQYKEDGCEEKEERLDRMTSIYGIAYAGVFWNHEEYKRKRRVKKPKSQKILGVEIPGEIIESMAVAPWNPVPIEVEYEYVIEEYIDVRSRPTLQIYSPFDVFVDPRPGVIELEDAEFVIVEEEWTKREIEEFLKNGGFDEGVLEELTEHGDGEVNVDKKEIIQYNNAIDENTSRIPRKYKIYRYFSRDTWIVVADRKHLIAEYENPFWHGMIPFFKTTIIDDTEDHYGKGFCDLISELQKILNRLMNSVINNSLWINNPAWTVIKSLLDNPNDANVIGPGVTISVKDHNAIKPFQVNMNIIAPLLQVAMQLIRDIEDVTGVNETISGVDREGTPSKTATEMSLKSQASNSRFDYIQKHLAEQKTKLPEFFTLLNQQFITDEMEYRGDGDKEFITVAPDQLDGEFDYCLSDDPYGAEDQKKKENVMTAYGAVSSNPMTAQLIDPIKSARKLFELSEVDPEDFLKDGNVSNGTVLGSNGIAGSNELSAAYGAGGEEEAINGAYYDAGMEYPGGADGQYTG